MGWSLSLPPSRHLEATSCFPVTGCQPWGCVLVLHPQNLPRAPSQKVRGARMVDIIAKLTRRQSRALRAQVGDSGIRGGRGTPARSWVIWDSEQGVSWRLGLVPPFLFPSQKPGPPERWSAWAGEAGLPPARGQGGKWRQGPRHWEEVLGVRAAWCGENWGPSWPVFWPEVGRPLLISRI